jgi:AmiR/NasT family two-component response regulator
MNVFHGAVAGSSASNGAAAGDAASSEQVLLGQAFADIATIVMVQSTDLTLRQVTDRVQQALQARTSIEQAKGVLAYRHSVDMADAYELLRRMAGADSTLTATAAAVIAEARRRSDG